ncbi:hypothetical protein CC86DRAFT_248873, partial [Ophiobolus disseminans]
ADNQFIVWVAVDEDDERRPVKDSRSTSIHWHRHSNVEGAPWLKPANVKCIEGILGTAFAFSGRTLQALHQGVMTGEILHHRYPYRILYMKSPAAAVEYLGTLDALEKKGIMMWLVAHQDVKPSTWTFAYDTLTHECGSIFPPREEIVWADFKVYDIQAFGRITGEDKAYRPFTCFTGKNDHHCFLSSDATSVLKRSHSCGAGHVRIMKLGKQLETNEEDDTMVDEYYRWMQQEYVPSLVDFGELRVFIATRAGDGKNREPHVVSVIRTVWTDAKYTPLGLSELCKPGKLGGFYCATNVQPQFKWPEYLSLSYEKLTDFALGVYRRLQDSGDKGFQSLAVGGRLDIGIAPDGQQFFVNELTRWYGAHQFALNTQSQPGDKICRTYAKAFAEVLG